ncbi:3-oxoacid CoA-transferase subunit B [Botrimarina hoheduenensis]|uniref:Putative succinyl-CoA:3-ketoacid coenzyme A transferase subunit B n=1 Tax=Botrimarina hoheduenensis TaxID=2528000 RepID=A0A5C5WCN2_9BACT|nr:3-oxoacid CoA-transferase subunit B [Botrimarina hoheduenensis]TWT47835.1 putative succinyl-CoA:3-ketoacid coenzyme A transferase subunit B [Botrimarina hoheduenensis]
MVWTKEQMADEIVGMLTDGCSLNLGIGMPTLIAERLPAERQVFIHSENGVLGVEGRPTRETISPTLINAGKESISVRSGVSYFDSATSFGIIRGGHIDFCVLGGMQVDVRGSLANWMIPGKKVTGMGGAMDLVHGAKRVIVMLTHFAKDGSGKLMARCTWPLTGVGVVHTVITELGIFSPTGTAFRVDKLADGVSADDLWLPAELLC